MFPDTTPSSIFTLHYWDKVGVKLDDLAAMGHKQAERVLLAWRVIFEAFTKEEQSQGVSSAGAASPLPALTLPGAPGTGEWPEPSTPLCPDKGGKGILSHGPEQPVLLTVALAVRRRGFPSTWDQ